MKVEGLTGGNLIAGNWSKQGQENQSSINPATGETSEVKFSHANEEEIKQACERANRAMSDSGFRNFRKRADLLDQIVEEIGSLGDELIEAACFETGLPSARIQGEKGRTMFQIREFARLIRTGGFLKISVDTANPDRNPIPKPEIKKINQPIGPVAVFSASNFPLAFSTAGGDTASALAAGCSVVLKGHECHPITNELIASAIQKGIQKMGFDQGIFSFVNGGYDVGKQLVMNRNIQAVAFTGSFMGGNALLEYANQREDNIPVFCEMGSINPIIISKGAQRSIDGLAETIAGSVFLGTGQFCTNPGLLLVENSEDSPVFLSNLKDSLSSNQPTPMLSSKIYEGFSKKVSEIVGEKPEEVNHSSGFFHNIIAEEFLSNQSFSEEVFGPFTLAVTFNSQSELLELIHAIPGQLTGSLYIQDDEAEDYGNSVSQLAKKVGRLIFKGVPTGVEVCPSMQHGGPWPSSSDARFTSVGFDALFRFLRPVSFQSMPDWALPEELRNDILQNLPHQKDI